MRSPHLRRGVAVTTRVRKVMQITVALEEAPLFTACRLPAIKSALLLLVLLRLLDFLLGAVVSFSHYSSLPLACGAQSSASERNVTYCARKVIAHAPAALVTKTCGSKVFLTVTGGFGTWNFGEFRGRARNFSRHRVSQHSRLTTPAPHATSQAPRGAC